MKNAQMCKLCNHRHMLGESHVFGKVAEPVPDVTKLVTKVSEEIPIVQDACAICNEVPEGYSLHYDHDHATGKFRGWLCRRCNTGLGMFRDRPDLLIKAIRYLAQVSPDDPMAKIYKAPRKGPLYGIWGKVGRPSVGTKPMTPAERQRRHRGANHVTAAPSR